MNIGRDIEVQYVVYHTKYSIVDTSDGWSIYNCLILDCMMNESNKILENI
jgi:hypothetical protein